VATWSGERSRPSMRRSLTPPVWAIRSCSRRPQAVAAEAFAG
jgi:hypothetical protein